MKPIEKFQPLDPISWAMSDADKEKQRRQRRLDTLAQKVAYDPTEPEGAFLNTLQVVGGVLGDFVGAPVRAMQINQQRALRQVLEGKADSRDWWTAIVPTSSVLIRDERGLSDKQPGEYVNPLLESARALTGKTTISYIDHFLDLANEHADRTGKEVPRAAVLAAGLAADIFGDPTTYVTAGVGAIGKAAKTATIAQKFGKGVKATDLAEIGLDIPRLVEGVDERTVGELVQHGYRKLLDESDEFESLDDIMGAVDEATALTRQVEDIGFAELPSAMQRTIESSAVKYAGDATEGGRYAVPFLRRTERGVRPTLPFTRASREGGKVDVPFMTRPRDEGGIKFMGQQIADVQPAFDRFGYALGRVHPARWFMPRTQREIVEEGSDTALEMWKRGVATGHKEASRITARESEFLDEMKETLGPEDAPRLGVALATEATPEDFAKATELAKETRKAVRAEGKTGSKVASRDEFDEVMGEFAEQKSVLEFLTTANDEAKAAYELVRSAAKAAGFPVTPEHVEATAKILQARAKEARKAARQLSRSAQGVKPIAAEPPVPVSPEAATLPRVEREVNAISRLVDRANQAVASLDGPNASLEARNALGGMLDEAIRAFEKAGKAEKPSQRIASVAQGRRIYGAAASEARRVVAIADSVRAKNTEIARRLDALAGAVDEYAAKVADETVARIAAERRAYRAETQLWRASRNAAETKAANEGRAAKLTDYSDELARHGATADEIADLLRMTSEDFFALRKARGEAMKIAQALEARVNAMRKAAFAAAEAEEAARAARFRQQQFGMRLTSQRMERAAVALERMGVAPDEIATKHLPALRAIHAKLDELLQAEVEAGVLGGRKGKEMPRTLLPYAESTAYMRQRNFLDESGLHNLMRFAAQIGGPAGEFLNRAADRLMSARGAERNRLIRQMFGVDPTTLRATERMAGVDDIWLKRKQAKARATGRRQFRTPWQRLEAGYEVEFDMYGIVGERMAKHRDAIQKATIEDEFIRLGSHLSHAEAQTLGLVPYTVHRLDRGTGAVSEITTHLPQSFINAYHALKDVDKPGGFLKAFDKVMRFWKPQVTALRPGFHIRNAMSNYYLGWANGFGDEQSWADGIELQRIKRRMDNGVATASEMNRTVTVGNRTLTARGLIDEAKGSVMREMWGRIDDIHDIEHSAQALGGGVLRRTGRKVLDYARTMGSNVEDASRMAVYVSALRQGADPMGAARIVDATLYDYSMQFATKGDRLARRLIPFAAWTKQNIPAMVLRAAQTPGKVKWYPVLVRDALNTYGIDERDLPEHMRNTGYIPIRLGDSIYMWNPNMPLQDIVRFAPSVLSRGGDRIADVVQNVAEVLNPILGAAITMIAGRETFSKAEVSRRAKAAPPVVQWADNRLAGAEAWDDFVDTIGGRVMNEDTGEMQVVISGYADYAIKQSVPFLYEVLNGTDAAFKGDYRKAARLLFGITYAPLDEAMMERQESARLRLYEQEARVLKSFGKLSEGPPDE